jgi:hypothetical protein
MGGRERVPLALKRSRGAVVVVVLGACLDRVFLRFYLINWNLFTFSGRFQTRV